MPTVAIDGVTTRYEISGSGPPILLMAQAVLTSLSRNGPPLGRGSIFCHCRPLRWSTPISPTTAGKPGAQAAGSRN
jgi:hypothetical protein